MEKKYYIPVGKEKVYVEKEMFDEFNRIRSRQAYSNNKYRNNTFPILESDENILLSNAEDEAIKNIEYAVLYKAIEKLDEKERDIIKWIFFENKTEQEIAKKSNVSQKTINRYKVKILKKLKDLIFL